MPVLLSVASWRRPRQPTPASDTLVEKPGGNQLGQHLSGIWWCTTGSDASPVSAHQCQCYTRASMRQGRRTWAKQALRRSTVEYQQWTWRQAGRADKSLLTACEELGMENRISALSRLGNRFFSLACLSASMACLKTETWAGSSGWYAISASVEVGTRSPGQVSPHAFSTWARRDADKSC